MKSEWKQVKLGEVLGKKGYIRGPFGSALKRGELLEDGPIPIYEQQHAIYGKKEFRYFIDYAKYEKLKRFTVKTNDIIISCSGTIGKASIIEEKDVKGIISQALLILRADTSVIYPKYLLYFIQSKEGYHAITSRSSGSVQVNIARRETIENIPLICPSLTEQKNIVAILSSIDNKIELNNKININLEEQAQAIFKSWFVDFKPFQDGEFVDSEQGQIPKGWRVGKLSELINVKYGKDHKKLADGNIPVYGSGGIMRFAERALYDKESVLIPRKGTLSNVIYINEPFWTVDTMFYSEMLRTHIAKFVYFFVNSKDLVSMNAGSAVPSMTTEILNNIPVVIPSEKILLEYDKYATSVFNIISNKKKQNQILAAIRDALLPKLMSGEIEVPISNEEDKTHD